jgi:RNA polymerase subunit RPABC4/transcription elongation factor Spt4
MSFEQAVCAFCARVVEASDDFCPWCGKPLTTFATTDPLLSIRAEGEMIRGAMQRPTPVIVVGICLLFGPGLVLFVLFLGLAAFMLFDSSASLIGKAFGLVLSGFFAWLYFAIIRKVFRGYLASRKKQDNEASNRDDD